MLGLRSLGEAYDTDIAVPEDLLRMRDPSTLRPVLSRPRLDAFAGCLAENGGGSSINAHTHGTKSRINRWHVGSISVVGGILTLSVVQISIAIPDSRVRYAAGQVRVVSNACSAPGHTHHSPKDVFAHHRNNNMLQMSMLASHCVCYTLCAGSSGSFVLVSISTGRPVVLSTTAPTCALSVLGCPPIVDDGVAL